MSRRGTPEVGDEALLELWRPPADAGEPVGCIATTFTFDAEHFDRHCLGRFLGVESDPDREGIPFLIEREDALSKVYAGILVDHHHAKGSHSLRWDLLTVRVPGGIQHAKVSLLCWSRQIRILVGSANLTEPGYRQNRELVTVIDSREDAAHLALLEEVVKFLRAVLAFTPGTKIDLSPNQRAEDFLGTVLRQARRWTEAPTDRELRVEFAPTLPTPRRGVSRSAWDQAVEAATRGNRAIQRIALASPFFDRGDAERFVREVYGALGERGGRIVDLAVPALIEEGDRSARLAAPKAFWAEAEQQSVDLQVYQLPRLDQQGEVRPWHAKALLIESDRYAVLLTGSPNCTCAGLGIGRANIEAGLLHVVDLSQTRVPGHFADTIWAPKRCIKHPERAEWEGSGAEPGEEDTAPVLPDAFQVALYDGGERPSFHLTIDTKRLPQTWQVIGLGQGEHALLGGSDLDPAAGPTTVNVSWPEPYPPGELVVRWGEGAAAEWPFNVRDPGRIPPPRQLGAMRAEDLLRVLAAADPRMALRAWARSQEKGGDFDPDEDSAVPIDLDPLRRYDLGQTMLHVVRRRARLLSRYRRALGRAVWSEAALHSRLSGPCGARLLLDRVVEEALASHDGPDAGLLNVADTLIALTEVEYAHEPGAISRPRFEAIFRPFVAQAAAGVRGRVEPLQEHAARDVARFFVAVVEKCEGGE